MQSITQPAIKGTSQALMGSEIGWHKRRQGSVARKRMNPTMISRNPKRSNANAVFRFRSKSMVRPASERPYSGLLHDYFVPKNVLRSGQEAIAAIQARVIGIVWSALPKSIARHEHVF